MKTIYEMMQEGIFPKEQEERDEVEKIVNEITQHIKKNKYTVWGKDLPHSKECFAIEIIPDFFNGIDIPEGEHIFYLLKNEWDMSYSDYYKGYPLTFEKMASKYGLSKEQDRYFEYLMAKQGVLRKIIPGKFFPSEVRWYVI